MATPSLTRSSRSSSLIKKGSVILGNVRVQALSSTLVRIELKGPHGFEDRNTFTVTHRNRPIAPITVRKEDAENRLVYPDFQVVLPKRLRSGLAGVKVLDRAGKTLYEFSGNLPSHSFLPEPAEMAETFVVADCPRLVPPPWGATPPPPNNRLHPETSGWDTTNDAPDVYVFIPGEGGYAKLREDFLALLGAIPIPPLWTFGFWDSQWFPYSEKTALDSIDLYRSKAFPLDGFVVDTDWRVNGSDGYNIATNLFPDMKRFFTEAHRRGVHLVFNDHPEPAAGTALEPKELQYRWKGLTSLLRIGLDAWWFDRNWHTKLHEPMPGIAKEVWGQRLFHDITMRLRPRKRPFLMSNTDGIDNGNRNRPSHPASHRYPITWTGDTFAEWRYLQMGIANAVDFGVLALQPYINEDLGGHHSQPTNELYIRFLQFGALSPAMRVHCTLKQERHPWSFGEEAEQIVRDYTYLRYRLLPTIYSSARRAFEDGTPLLRRCDLEWPSYRKATSNQQFLFGGSLLIAPVVESRFREPKPISGDMFQTPDGKPGLLGAYYRSPDFSGEPVLQRVDPGLNFEFEGEPDELSNGETPYSARWTGWLGPAPETGDYILSTSSEDRLRFRLDGKLLVDQWIIRTIGEDQTLVRMEKGKSYPLEVEHLRRPGPLRMKLAWTLPSESKQFAERHLWLPPGEWRDLWTGDVKSGTREINLECPNRKMPMFVKQGAIVICTENAVTAGPLPWKSVVLEAFPTSANGCVVETLYEDDGISTQYLEGVWSKTRFFLHREGDLVTIRSDFEGCAPKICSCNVTIRLHLPKGVRATCDRLARELEPLEDEPSIPLGGLGSRPSPGEGPTMEVVLSNQALDAPFALHFKLTTT